MAKCSAFPHLAPCHPQLPARPQEPHLTNWLFHLCYSLQGSGPDPEVVPTLHGPPGDEAALHLEHLPVHRVCRAAGPGQGAPECGMGPPPALPLSPQGSMPQGAWKAVGHSWGPLLSLKPHLLGFLCSSTISSATLWITSPPAVTTRVSMNCHRQVLRAEGQRHQGEVGGAQGVKM